MTTKNLFKFPGFVIKYIQASCPIPTDRSDTVTDKAILRFRKGDLIAVFAVLALAAAVFVSFIPARQASASLAEIYQDGSLIKTVSLSEDAAFDITGEYTNTVAVQDGKIGISHSDCPGTDCVHTGFISAPGRSVVCLPNRVEIRVISGETDVDFVVR